MVYSSSETGAIERKPPPVASGCTEGEKDAAALHYIGLAAVTSPGGGKAADKADWSALQRPMDAGRRVLCWPDHDAPGRVYAATVAGLLGSACDCLVSLPEGTPDEAGAGAADWLAAAVRADVGREWDGLNPPGLTPEERDALRARLAGIVEAVRGPVPPDWTPRQAAAKSTSTHYRGADDGPPGYVATDRGIIRVYGEKESQLSNFTAQIVEEVLRDDGTQENARLLTIHGKRDGVPLPPAALSLEEFTGMNWPVKHWGTGCMVNPGQGARDHLKFAIQYLSHRGAKPINRTVFTHTGWREIGGAWVYLSAGAVIGADGPVDGIDVDLGDLGDLYRLPPPSGTPEQRREAAAASMDAATIAPPAVAIPLIACVYLAPFAQPISQKLFVLADGLAVIDDYAPQASAGDQAKLDRAVHEVLRGIGNRAGRGRLTSAIELQTRRPPRALALCTAEQYLHGESISARLFGVTMTPRSLDLERLNRTQAAAKAGTLARAMADYLSTVARDFVRYRDAARADWQRLRDEAMTAGLCGRTPDQVAFLLIGYGKALNHWQGAGLISEDTKIAMFTEARRVLYELAKIHERRIASAQPADTFVSILADLLLSGEAYLRGSDDGKPGGHPDRYGWRPAGTSGAHIGWVDEEKGELYLLKEAALDAIGGRARRIDNPLNIRASALLRQLKDRGFLLTGNTEQQDGKAVERTSLVKWIGGKSVHVLALPLSVLDHEGGD